MMTVIWMVVDQFKNLWWITLPVSITFGIQIILYFRLRKAIKERAKKVVAGSGVTSGAAMVACCAHHLTDVLPLIGFSALSLFLSKYQIPILIVSLVINLIVIKTLLSHLKIVTYENK